MALFAQLVLIPEGALVENVKAFLLLSSIVNMFLDEDQAVRQVDLLEQMFVLISCSACSSMVLEL